jgi:riboflavin kinase
VRCFTAQPFYGEAIRLVGCGYVRPEAGFSSLAALIQRIHEDAAVSRQALKLKPLAACARDSFLTPRGADQAHDQ